MGEPSQWERSKQYSQQRELQLDEHYTLGYGQDGTVWKSKSDTAVKVFVRERAFYNERDCYLRFQYHGIDNLAGFAIPGLVDFDDELWVVEMGIVTPPYLLDFGKAYLDFPPRYSYEDPAIMEAARSEWAEWWADRLGQVLSLLSELELYGIYYLDPKPGNIRFADAR